MARDVMSFDDVVYGPGGSGHRGAPGTSGSRPRGGNRGGHGGRPRGAGGPGRGRGRKRRSVAGRIGLGIAFAFLGAVIAGAVAFLIAYAKLTVPEPGEVALAQTSKVYYSDGKTPMGSFSKINRTIIDTSTLPDYVGHAVVASEDRTFYTNSGVDLRGIGRALVNNARYGTRQGGSTLSQQYVERYYVAKTTESYTGKLREAILALKINREQSKDQILGNYVNTIYFGRGAYGIEAASEAYFGHPASKLTVSESALLAGIIPAPSAWDPAVSKSQAEQRWSRVLDLMVEDGWISQRDRAAAKFPKTAEPKSSASTLKGTSGYLVQQAKTELVGTKRFSEGDLQAGGLRIVTTIDKKKQDAAVDAVKSLPSGHASGLRTALSSIDPATGEILAEYGGPDYQKTQSNAVTQDIAMGGSTFKAFALLTHLEQGGTTGDVYDGNSPASFSNGQLTVSNDGGYSWGSMTLLRATKYSVNTAFVHVNEAVGPKNTMQTAIKAGMPKSTKGLDGTLLNVLGFASPHNIDISHAYATIASGGVRTTPHIVREVKDADGQTVYKADTKGTRVFPAATVAKALPALESVMQQGGTGEKAAALGRVVAGKTGTSEDQLSAQFVGFIPQMVTAVSMYQVGEDGSAQPLTNFGGVNEFHGGDWPATVWVQYMEAATQGMPREDFGWVPTASATPSPSVTRYTYSATPTPTPTYQAPTPTYSRQNPTRSPSPKKSTYSYSPTPSPSTSAPAKPPGGGTGDDTGGSDVTEHNR